MISARGMDVHISRKEEGMEHPVEVFRKQLVRDLDRLHELILMYASGDRSVKQEMERL